jgi:hypothetical protein
MYNSTCIINCPIGTYKNYDICQKCDTSCLSCVGFSLYCTSCSVGNYFYNGQCLSNCPGSTYLSPSTYICKDCEPYCIVCTS